MGDSYALSTAGHHTPLVGRALAVLPKGYAPAQKLGAIGVVTVPDYRLRSEVSDARSPGATPRSEVRHIQTYVAHLGVW